LFGAISPIAKSRQPRYVSHLVNGRADERPDWRCAWSIPLPLRLRATGSLFARATREAIRARRKGTGDRSVSCFGKNEATNGSSLMVVGGCPGHSPLYYLQRDRWGSLLEFGKTNPPHEILK